MFSIGYFKNFSCLALSVRLYSYYWLLNFQLLYWVGRTRAISEWPCCLPYKDWFNAISKEAAFNKTIIVLVITSNWASPHLMSFFSAPDYSSAWFFPFSAPKFLNFKSRKIHLENLGTIPVLRHFLRLNNNPTIVTILEQIYMKYKVYMDTVHVISFVQSHVVAYMKYKV